MWGYQRYHRRHPAPPLTDEENARVERLLIYWKDLVRMSVPTRFY